MLQNFLVLFVFERFDSRYHSGQCGECVAAPFIVVYTIEGGTEQRYHGGGMEFVDATEIAVG